MSKSYQRKEQWETKIRRIHTFSFAKFETGKVSKKSENYKIWNLEKLKFAKFEICNVWNLEYLKFRMFEICKVWKVWKSEICKVWNLQCLKFRMFEIYNI